MQQRQRSKLMEFLDRFDGVACVLDEGDIPYDDSMSKPLLLLAKAFEHSGEYRKTIGIYLYLIRYEKSRELLEQLGRVYLRAGFLERAESIFLEILSQEPRHIEVLFQLGVVYEMMQEYDKALETLEPLETMGESVDTLRNFWEFERLLKIDTVTTDTIVADTATTDIKKTAILKVHSRYQSLYRHSISALFEISFRDAWLFVDSKRADEILDILWYLPQSQLDFDIIQSDSKLAKIYFARGVIAEIAPEQMQVSSGIVSIDILAAARSAGETRGELSFSYLCAKCKHSFPISFSRCPNCLAINTLITEEQIAKHEERDYSIF